MKLKLTLLALALSLGTAQAVIITQPMTLATEYVVGIHNGQDDNSNVNTERAIAQAILNLALGGVSGDNEANTVYDYSGVIGATSGVQGPEGEFDVPAGWSYALAKYDGKNGGYVLFALGGTATDLPQYPYNFWTTNHEQYAISHYTTFNVTGTPDPQNIPEGGVGVALFGLLTLGMGAVRRFVKA